MNGEQQDFVMIWERVERILTTEKKLLLVICGAFVNNADVHDCMIPLDDPHRLTVEMLVKGDVSGIQCPRGS